VLVNGPVSFALVQLGGIGLWSALVSAVVRRHRWAWLSRPPARPGRVTSSVCQCGRCAWHNHYVSTQRPTLLAAAAGAFVAAVASQALLKEGTRNIDTTASEPEVDGSNVTADDLDKELMDQLHAATLKASDSCFEIKKLCATVLVPTGTLVALFSDRRLSVGVFVAGVLVIGFFWMADAVGYYYQRRLRGEMDVIWRRRAERCEEVWIPPNVAKTSPVRAAFNGSMTFYALLAIPVLLAASLFAVGLIGSPGTVSP